MKRQPKRIRVHFATVKNVYGARILPVGEYTLHKIKYLSPSVYTSRDYLYDLSDKSNKLRGLRWSAEALWEGVRAGHLMITEYE